MDSNFCDTLLNCDINFDYGIPTVPITPEQVLPYQPVMSYAPSSCESVCFPQQQQQQLGGVDTLAEISQPMLSEGGTVVFDPIYQMGDELESIVHAEQYNFKVTVAQNDGVRGRGKQFKFVEKNNMLYCKPKQCIPFNFSTSAPVPAGCWIRAVVVFASELVARGPVKRCANHVSEDRQAGQLANVEHFMQCRMEEAVYCMTSTGQYCVSVPFDRLADGVCLFSFACYNSCLEYKDDSRRKAKLVKPGLQILFSLIDPAGTHIGEDTVDLRVCACPARDAPSDSNKGSVACPTTKKSRTRQQLRGVKHHSRTHKMKKSHHHKQHHQHQQSLESVVKKVQQMEQLDRDDIIDERRGLYKFTCMARTKEQYQLLCLFRAAFQQQKT